MVRVLGVAELKAQTLFWELWWGGSGGQVEVDETSGTLRGIFFLSLRSGPTHSFPKTPLNPISVSSVGVCRCNAALQESFWPLAHLHLSVYLHSVSSPTPTSLSATCTLNNQAIWRGHSPVYFCSWLLFLVTVTMFTPGLSITDLSAVL